MNESVFDDWQRVKLQENTSEIPAGSMPRSLDLILRNSLVEQVKPGDRVVATGSLVVLSTPLAEYGYLCFLTEGGNKASKRYYMV